MTVPVAVELAETPIALDDPVRIARAVAAAERTGPNRLEDPVNRDVPEAD